MKKKILSSVALVATLVLSLVSCTDEYKYDGVGAADAEDVAGVYFPASNKSSLDLEVTDPLTTTFKVARLNTNGALTVPLTVEVNDDNVFQIPASATFADGEAEATVEMPFPNAEIGKTYNFTITVPREYINSYKQVNGSPIYSGSAIRLKWESLGQGYWADGTLSVFGVQKLPFVISNIEKAVLADEVRYRFVSPFAQQATGQEQGTNAYIGLPMKGFTFVAGTNMIVSVKKKAATFLKGDLGCVHSTYGSLTVGNGESAGSYNENGGFIKFASGTYTLDLANYGTLEPAESIYIFLSKEKYNAYMTTHPNAW